MSTRLTHLLAVQGLGSTRLVWLRYANRVSAKKVLYADATRAADLTLASAPPTRISCYRGALNTSTLTDLSLVDASLKHGTWKQSTYDFE